jgi:hypothetical protein
MQTAAEKLYQTPFSTQLRIPQADLVPTQKVNKHKTARIALISSQKKESYLIILLKTTIEIQHIN